MHGHGRVQRLQFPDVRGEVLVAEVADVDGAGAVVGELVGGGAADAEGGVGARYDYHFVWHATVARVVSQSALGPSGDWWGGDVRSCRVACYAADFGDVFKGAGVGGLDDELLAEGLEAGFGDGGHAGVFEGVEELLVLVGRHHRRGMVGIEKLRGHGEAEVGDEATTLGTEA